MVHSAHVNFAHVNSAHVNSAHVNSSAQLDQSDYFPLESVTRLRQVSFPEGWQNRPQKLSRHDPSDGYKYTTKNGRYRYSKWVSASVFKLRSQPLWYMFVAIVNVLRWSRRQISAVLGPKWGYWKLISKSPRCVTIDGNLTQFWPHLSPFILLTEYSLSSQISPLSVRLAINRMKKIDFYRHHDTMKL